MSTIKDAAMRILLAKLLLTEGLSVPVISTVSTSPGVTRTAQIKHNYSDSKNILLKRMNARCVLCHDRMALLTTGNGLPHFSRSTFKFE